MPLLFSQTQPMGSGNIPGGNILEDIIKASNLNVTQYNDIGGTPYLDANFKLAHITTSKHKNLGSLKARYNTFSDEIEILNSNGSKGSLNKSKSIRIDLNNDIFIALNYFDDKKGIRKDGFFIEKISNKYCSFYIKHTTTIKKGTKAKSGYHKPTDSKFIAKKSYFVKFEKEELKPIVLKKKIILKSFSPNVDDLKKFISENNLSLKNEDDLISLINYYNSLQ